MSGPHGYHKRRDISRAAFSRGWMAVGARMARLRLARVTLALGAKRKEGLSAETQAIDSIEELVLVAGVGFEPTTFRL